MKISFLIAFLLTGYTLTAQNMSRIHIDMSNGLPDNHVYNMMRDRFGYLWMTTPKGVVRYNGYNFKIFGIADGLPTEDVWLATEDKKGRVWLSSISKSIGYIYNDHYKNAFCNVARLTFYPKIIYKLGDGIAFSTQFTTRRGLETALCIENNDTIFPIASKVISRYLAINEEYKFPIETITNIDRLKKALRNVFIFSFCNIKMPKHESNKFVYFHKNVFSYSPAFSGVYVNNIKTCKWVKLKLKSDVPIYLIYKEGDYFHIITKKQILLLDSSIHLIASVNIHSLVDDKTIDGSKISFIFIDSLWHQCISTTTNGVYINYDIPYSFKKISALDLSGYKYIGSSANKLGYWWNTSTETLAQIASIKKVKYFYKIKNATKIVPYNNDTSVLLSRNGVYWLNNNSGKTTDIFSHLRLSRGFVELTVATDAQILASNEMFLLFSMLPGLCHITIANTLAKSNEIDYDRYKSVIQIQPNFLCAYDYCQMLLLRDNRKNIISAEMLNSVGIKKIENILVDKFQNIFIKDYDKLWLINLHTYAVTQLLSNYVLENTTIAVQDSMLIVAGNYGILFSKITGRGKVANPLLYQNVKGALFNDVVDMQITSNEVLLKTDRGLFLAKVPRYNELNKAKRQHELAPFNFVVRYGNKQININTGDTIQINQNAPVLQFDVINAVGNGSVKYTYRINDGAWTSISTNEIHLPRLLADNYFNLSIKVEDNSRKSNPINVKLYIIPNWWQAKWSKRLLWVASLLLIISTIYLIVFVTKKIVIKKNLRKSSMLELELKSIYSQINPHFIFNALNSVQLSIQKKRLDVAYIQVNKFSKLLRSYIESSRNKFIRIEDEIHNLRNYIDLQQTRFKDKFIYDIVIEEGSKVADAKIPSLLLQPLVENAINHGLFHKQGGGYLKIEFKISESTEQIICIIDDDGVGRKKSNELNEESLFKRKSYGSQLTKELIDIFNLYEDMHIEIYYIDKEFPQTGTIVELRLKNILYGK